MVPVIVNGSASISTMSYSLHTITSPRTPKHYHCVVCVRQVVEKQSKKVALANNPDELYIIDPVIVYNTDQLSEVVNARLGTNAEDAALKAILNKVGQSCGRFSPQSGSKPLAARQDRMHSLFRMHTRMQWPCIACCLILNTLLIICFAST